MLTIRSVDPAPPTPDDADYRSVCRLITRYNHELIGGPEWDTDPEADLAEIKADTDHRRVRYLAEVDGEGVGYGNLFVNERDEPDAGNVLVYVVPEHRRAGIGTQLLARVNEHAAALGLRRLVAWVLTPVPQGPTVRPEHGVGEMPADHEGVRMALRDGFVLGQVERVSRYDFAAPLVDPHEALAAAQAKAGADYQVLTWVGITPADLAEDLARIQERMSRDVPAGGLTVVERDWDAARILEADRRTEISRRLYRAAVRHVPSGQLVAMSQLTRDTSNDRAFVEQWDTAVLPAHRGHRLGMLVKAANLIQVREAEPSATGIITWNAEENRPMLTVNEALGFEEVMREAAFEKQL